MYNIDVIASLKDNYIYAIKEGTQAVVVDPGSYDNLHNYLKDQQVAHVDVLLTHGHFDHVAAVGDLLVDYPTAKVYGQKEVLDAVGIPDDMQVAVAPDTTFTLQGKTFLALNTPGHCKHHYCYVVDKNVFTGDLLFALGCGRVQEDGDYTDLYLSIDKVKSYAYSLGATNRELMLYPGHEYTLDNIAYAKSLDDASLAPKLAIIEARVNDRFAHGAGNTPVNFYEELDYNPFLRCVSAQEFARLRAAKDMFKDLVNAVTELQQALENNQKVK